MMTTTAATDDPMIGDIRRKIEETVTHARESERLQIKAAMLRRVLELRREGEYDSDRAADELETFAGTL